MLRICDAKLNAGEQMTTFKDLGLDENILEAVEKLGFEEPTEIQTKAIPFILKGTQDLIALAQTGTGKTGAFGLSCLQKINVKEKNPQLIILSPTRELALQTARELKKFSKKMPGVRSVAVYGGADLRSQSQAIRNGCQIVVGTPGRTLDFIRRGVLKLSTIQMVVLDEADEMLKMGFQEDLESILAETPDEKQVLLFSATMPRPIENMAKRYMNEPEKIVIGKRNEGTKQVDHSYFVVHRNDRYEGVKRLVDQHPGMYGLIFCRTKLETVDVSGQLRKDGYHVDLLNGDLSQKQRDHVMRQFRRKELQLLVATDVAARGLDVNNLTHVINFNLPDDLEVYIHRSGRTGRAGKKGQSLLLLTPSEKRRLRVLERILGRSFTQRQIPSGEEISIAQVTHLIDKMKSVPVREEILDLYKTKFESELEEYTPEEIIARLLSVLCGETLKSYQDAPDLNQRANQTKKKKQKQQGRSRTAGRGSRDQPRNKSTVQNKKKKNRSFQGRYTKCSINLGEKDGLNPNRLMGLINECLHGKKPSFGRIDISQQNTVFEIDELIAKQAASSTSGATFEGRKVVLSLKKTAEK
jgi:ATP-dependent RNA helicase DeaD